MKRIYIAGPISKDPLGGARAAIQAAHELAEHGFVPYVPQLCVLWEIMQPRAYQEWMRIGFEWLTVCHAVLRLPGESKGADAETDLAKRMNIPVFESIEELKNFDASSALPPEGCENAALAALAFQIGSSAEREVELMMAVRQLLSVAVRGQSKLMPGTEDAARSAAAIAMADRVMSR